MTFLTFEVVALHVGCHIEEISHERSTTSEGVCHPLWVVEHERADAFWMCVFSAVRVEESSASVSAATHFSTPRLVEIILERFAYIVVNTCRRVGCIEFLALSCHGQDATDDYRGACVDGHILLHENFWKMLSHALADAVVLTFSHNGEVAHAPLGCGKHLLQFFERFLAERCNLSLFLGFQQRVDTSRVVAIAQ